MAQSSLFGVRARNDGEQDMLRQLAFEKLKAVCVPILSTSHGHGAGGWKGLLELLKKLQGTLDEIPPGVFRPALGHYVFFPLSGLLAPAKDAPRPYMVTEAALGVLRSLVARWKGDEGSSMQDKVVIELWVMLALMLGGPLDAQGTTGAAGKGKSKALSEEMQHAIIMVLLELMQVPKPRVDAEDDFLGEELDWEQDDPLAAVQATRAVAGAAPKPLPWAPPISIVFHTLSALLELIGDADVKENVRLGALQALGLLLEHYLAPPPPPKEGVVASDGPTGPSAYIATALPGTASTLIRVITSAGQPKSVTTASRRTSSKVVVAALDVYETLLLNSISDSITLNLRPRSTVPSSLSNLANGAPPPASEAHSPAAATPRQPGSSSPPTLDWLKFTIQNVAVRIKAFGALASHESPSVRQRFALFVGVLLFRCRDTLKESRVTLVEILLLFADDEWPDVKEAAVGVLADLKQSQNAELNALLSSAARSGLLALNGNIQRKDEEAVARAARIARVAVEHIGVDGLEFISTDSVKWTRPLLDSLEFQRVPGRTAGQPIQAWITDSQDGDYGASGGGMEMWPALPLKLVEGRQTVGELGKLWSSFGEKLPLPVATAMVGEFLANAAGQKATPRGATSLWIVERLLGGVAASPAAQAPAAQKLVKSVVRRTLSLLEDLSRAEEPGANEDRATAQLEEETAPSLISTMKHGETLTPSLDEYKPAQIHSDAGESTVALMQSLSLRLLSTAATILGPHFQPFNITALYHVLSQSSSAGLPIGRAHARLALSRIAEALAFPSPVQLVLGNVDYVVNSVSQQLNGARLDPVAPLVLVEMINLVGAPILPMVQDLVEDVFETLDDYHGYDELATGLWAVLDSLTHVMHEGLPEGSSQIKTPASWLPVQPVDNVADALETWLQERDETEKAEEEKIGPNPRQPFAEKVPDLTEDEELAETEEAVKDVPRPPPTRSQTVSAQILTKSIYFFSHPSPLLRARILSLFAAAVPVLTSPSVATDPESTRESDLLPILNHAWPFIMNRLDDELPYVAFEAVHVIEELATHTKHFMSRRIVDDVWPRFKTILGRQALVDDQSIPSAMRDSVHTITHKIYASLLRTMLQVVTNVPIKEEMLWELAVLLRRFLDASVPPDLQELARTVYTQLMRLNEDAVWVVLQGSVENNDGLPAFLAEHGWDLVDNVQQLVCG